MSTATPAQKGYVLNVAPVELAGGPLVADRLPFSAELLKDLHIRTSETHVVRRDGESILCVPMTEGPPSLGGEAVVVDLRENLYVAGSLLRHALLAYLNKLGRTVLHFRPLTFLADGKGNDYLASALPPDVPNPGLLRVSPVFELDVRVITPEDQSPYVALTLNVRVSRRILASCADLLREGVDVRGVYVKRVAEIGDTRLAPKLETVGQVEAVEGETLRLVDHREETPTIPASEAYPQARSDFFKRCVSALFVDTRKPVPVRSGVPADVRRVAAERRGRAQARRPSCGRVRRLMAPSADLPLHVWQGAPSNTPPWPSRVM